MRAPASSRLCRAQTAGMGTLAGKLPSMLGTARSCTTSQKPCTCVRSVVAPRADDLGRSVLAVLHSSGAVQIVASPRFSHERHVRLWADLSDEPAPEQLAVSSPAQETLSGPDTGQSKQKRRRLKTQKRLKVREARPSCIAWCPIAQPVGPRTAALLAVACNDPVLAEHDGALESLPSPIVGIWQVFGEERDQSKNGDATTVPALATQILPLRVPDSGRDGGMVTALAWGAPSWPLACRVGPCSSGQFRFATAEGGCTVPQTCCTTKAVRGDCERQGPRARFQPAVGQAGYDAGNCARDPH